MDELLPRYVRADRRALRISGGTCSAGRGLFSLAAMAVTFAVTQEVFFHEQMWPGLLEIAAMAVAWLLHAMSRRRGDHEKWLPIATLPSVRTGLFTVLVGEFPVPRSSRGDAPLPFYPGPQNWLVASLDRMIADTRRMIPRNSLPLAQTVHRPQLDWRPAGLARPQRKPQDSIGTASATSGNKPVLPDDGPGVLPHLQLGESHGRGAVAVAGKGGRLSGDRAACLGRCRARD